VPKAQVVAEATLSVHLISSGTLELDPRIIRMGSSLLYSTEEQLPQSDTHVDTSFIAQFKVLIPTVLMISGKLLGTQDNAQETLETRLVTRSRNSGS
jgi:hypothetical protein